MVDEPSGLNDVAIGSLSIERFINYSGLENLRGMINGELPAPAISKTLNFILTEAEENRVLFEGVPTDAFLNPMGTIHGGWSSTILDSALTLCVMTTLAAGEAMTTIEFKVNCVRPILPSTGLVRCEGRVIHRGRTTATSEAFMHDKNGKLLAHGTETSAIFPASKLG